MGQGAGVSSCAGETTKNIFSPKDNSNHPIYGNKGEESGGGKGKGVCEHKGVSALECRTGGWIGRSAAGRKEKNWNPL